MKKTNITGWKDVFSFTLIQTLKSKAFIISSVIILVLVMASMPIIKMATSSGEVDADAPSPIKKVYINNKTKLPAVDFSELSKDKALGHITFELLKEDYDAAAKKIEDKEKDSVILTLEEGTDKYSLNFVKASKGPVKEKSLQLLGDAAVKQFDAFRIKTLGIKAEQMAMINSAVETKVTMTDVNGTEIVKENTAISNSEYWFIYGILFVVLMVNMMASTQIATSIVTEKSSRVIEYLLITVKPLAIMVGKILAMLTAVLLQMIAMVVLLFASNKISANLSSGSGKSVMTQYLPQDIFQNLNIPNIILCFILILLGMIFYATLAGLAGATISRQEELSEGLTLFTFTNLIGVYIGIGGASTLMGAGMNGFVTFSFLFPLSSPFILPGALLVGKAGILLTAAAIVLQLLFIVLLLRFVARVYETLILHNGNKIKLKELLKLSKTV